MISVVPDTNIIISSIFWQGKPYEVIRRGILGDYQLIISNEILDEVMDKLKNKFSFPEDNIHELIDIILTYCQIIEPVSRFDIVRDKTDNKILECAFDCKADKIVTGDQDLLDLKEFKGIKIVTAKEFLDDLN